MEVYMLVGQKHSKIWKILSYIMLALAFVCFLLGAMRVYIFFVGTVLFLIMWYYWGIGMNVEYEYSYFDDEIRFSKITNKSRRKNLKSYDMSRIITIAPTGDRSVYRYENDKSVKVKDYTSGLENENSYDIVVKDDKGETLLLVELDERFLNEVEKKHRDKVKRKEG